MNVDSSKELNLMNLNIIRCNKITIKKIKCNKEKMHKKYYIKLYSNDSKPQISKKISFKKSKVIELNQSFPLETFKQKIIEEIKFEFYQDKDDPILLFHGTIINQNFIFDKNTGDYIIHLYDDIGNDSIIIYYSIEFSVIDSFDTFDKSVKYNEYNNQNYLQMARKGISQDENLKNEFIENLVYLEIIVLYFNNIIKWENIIETLLFMISISFIILYFKIFYIYIFPISIIFIFIKNKNKIKQLIKNKKDINNKINNDIFFMKCKIAYNNFIELYEVIIQKVIAGRREMIIETYKSLILTVIGNIFLFYFNVFYLIKWKWIIIIILWTFVLSYNSFCVKIYNYIIKIFSSFFSIFKDNKYYNKIQYFTKCIINLLIPFYPLYKSFKEKNDDIYSTLVKSQGMQSSPKKESTKIVNAYKKSNIGNNLIKFELYENERWWVVVGWSKNTAGDTPAWCRVDKPYEYCDKTKIFLPNDEYVKYQWSAEWKIEKTDNTDSQGWEYADKFDSEFSKDDKFKYVRRRKWVRYANKI